MHFDRAIISDDAFVAQEREIHDILFPNIPSMYGDSCLQNATIEAAGVSLVTRDGNFDESTKAALEALGAGLIATPVYAISRLSVGIESNNRSSPDSAMCGRRVLRLKPGDMDDGCAEMH